MSSTASSCSLEQGADRDAAAGSGVDPMRRVTGYVSASTMSDAAPSWRALGEPPDGARAAVGAAPAAARCGPLTGGGPAARLPPLSRGRRARRRAPARVAGAAAGARGRRAGRRSRWRSRRAASWSSAWPGEARPQPLLNDERWAQARSVLVARVAEAAARLHAIEPPDFLPARARAGGRGARPRRLRRPRPRSTRSSATSTGSASRIPRSSSACAGCASHPRAGAPPSIVHGDFRLSNLVVAEDGRPDADRLGARPRRRRRRGPRLDVRAVMALRRAAPALGLRLARGAARRLRRGGRPGGVARRAALVGGVRQRPLGVSSACSRPTAT